jgi:hypothetical protein
MHSTARYPPVSTVNGCNFAQWCSRFDCGVQRGISWCCQSRLIHEIHQRIWFNFCFFFLFFVFKLKNKIKTIQNRDNLSVDKSHLLKNRWHAHPVGLIVSNILSISLSHLNWGNSFLVVTRPFISLVLLQLNKLGSHISFLFFLYLSHLLLFYLSLTCVCALCPPFLGGGHTVEIF